MVSSQLVTQEINHYVTAGERATGEWRHRSRQLTAMGDTVSVNRHECNTTNMQQSAGVVAGKWRTPGTQSRKTKSCFNFRMFCTWF